MVLVTLSPPPGWLAKICYTFKKDAMSVLTATHLFSVKTTLKTQVKQGTLSVACTPTLITY